MNKFIKKYILYIIPIMLSIAAISIITINSRCSAYAITEVEIKPQDIIEYEHKESIELKNAVTQMYIEIEEENIQLQKELTAEVQRQALEDKCRSNIKEEDIKALGNTIYGESRGLSDLEQSAVAWCVLNRVDNGNYGKNVVEVVSAKNQFCGYVKDRTYKSEQAKEILKHCEEIAEDVLFRHELELNGVENVGRTLPKDYLYFYGKDGVNKFTKQWKAYDTIWNWSLENPYK